MCAEWIFHPKNSSYTLFQYFIYTLEQNIDVHTEKELAKNIYLVLVYGHDIWKFSKSRADDYGNWKKCLKHELDMFGGQIINSPYVSDNLQHF